MMINISVENGTPVYSFGSGNEKTKRDYKGRSLLEFLENYTVIDIETTGLSPQFDSIIEIAALRIQDGKCIDKFSSLIKPDEKYEYEDDDDVDYIIDDDGKRYYYINSFISQLTGITNAMLHDAPTINLVLPNFQKFVGDDIIIGHNVNFDINFLYDNFNETLGIAFSNNFIDTMRIARRVLADLPHHRLKDLSEYYSLETESYHRAEKDCHVTNECFLRLQHDIKEKYGDISTFITEIKSISYKSIKAKDIQSSNGNVDISHPLYGKKCVFTGALEKLKRKDAMQIVADLGGINQDNVNSETNLLILGNNDYCSTIKGGKSAKQKKAEMLKLKGNDIEILPESVFYDMVCIDS